MVLLARLFPTARRSRPAAAPSRRRRPQARHRRGRSLARLPSLATESLERRALLAVSATLAGGDLLITYNEPGDLLADISSDGTNYTVTGTGLASKTFKIADVTGVISVADKADLGGQEFKVLTGTAALANPLQVNANVEATLLSGGITASKVGDVLIGSSAITLANDISTAATKANIAFTGAVTLAKNTTLNAAAGAISFENTVDGAFTLTANSTGATTFGGAVGGAKALVSLATNAGGTASLLSVTTTGTQTYNDDTVTLNDTYTTTDANFTVDKAVTLAGNTVVSTGTADVAFKGTVDGASTLTVADANDVSFLGKVGATRPLAGITLQKAASVTSEDTISLDGTPALATDGITIAAGVNKVSLTKDGSTIQNFSANGIWFQGGSTDSKISGFTIKANGGDGVLLDAGGYSGTTIAENSIYANKGDGVRLDAAVGPLSIADNLKIDANGLNGVYAENSTTVSIAGNSIVENKNHGVWVLGGGGVIAGNGIEVNGGNGALLAGGYDVTTNLIDANALNGIEVVTGLLNLEITGNTITSNDLDGIVFNAGGVTGFDVSGNEIDANTNNGILVGAGTYTGTVIGGGNEITRNDQNGIELGPGGVAGLLITGNSIGTLADGTTDAGNALDGIQVNAGGHAGTTITGNAIAFNDADGIHLAAAGSVIQNLWITGNAISANDSDGIQADPGDYAGTVIRLQNLISENKADGIYLAAAGTTITNLTIGGDKTAPSQGNQIFANKSDGIQADAGIYAGTVIQGNEITTNDQEGIFLNADSGTIEYLLVGAGVGGAVNLGNEIDANTNNGILVGAGTYTGTVIGGGNEITRNNQNGIELAAGGVVGLLISGNTIGTLADGTTDAGNVLDGIQVNAGGHAGTSITGNAIAFNDADGIHLAAAGSVIQNLWITGNSIFANDSDGIQADPGDYAGTVIRLQNLIFGNAADGIYLAAAGTTITNLAIGGDKTLATSEGNQISVNKSDGIQADAGIYAGTVIQGNEIRDNGSPTTHEGNGILVEGSNLMIGWTAAAGQPNTVGNTITGNAANGIEIRGAAAVNNTIMSNSIFLNEYVGDVAAQGVRSLGVTEDPNSPIVGAGIALVDGGNGDLASPRILAAVADNATDVMRVQIVVPAAGSYYVQLFANTAADERGLVPVDVNGFEGRTYVGDSPAQASSPVTAGKPAISGTLVDGNTVAAIEIPGGRVAPGDWLTATATLVDGTTPGNTSPFSEAVQLAGSPVLAVGSDGPAVWVPHYNYRALSGNVLRLGGLTITEVNRLVAMRGRQIFVSADGRPEVATATVASVRRIGGRAVNMVLRNIASPGGSLAGTAGRFEPGPLTLPTARLYDASTGDVVLDVGAEQITAALAAAGVEAAAVEAFASRFQGGLRVASGDVDGDGFADLVTAPGASPTRPAITFGASTRIITIHNGDAAAAGWQSASVDVSSAFPGYSGGFQVTLGDVLPEAAGSGGVLELIVAGTNTVAVYELAVAERGGLPVIDPVPAAVWTIGPRFRVTGLAAGDFSAAASDEVVLATTGPGGTALRTFTIDAGSFQASRSAFWIRSYVQADPRRRLRDVFAAGATLAVGDVDGAADGKPELVMAAANQGLANFRVLANDLVATGTQAEIDTALAVGNGFTRACRPQSVTVNGRRVWQPAGGPDYFAGIQQLPNAFARGINAPLSVAVVNADGRAAGGQVFAALGPQNTTSNMIRRLAWSSLEAAWNGTDAFEVQPSGRTRFPVGGGLRLG